MRVASALVLIASLGFVEGCRARPGSAPYPAGAELRIQADGGRSFVLHLAGTGGECRAQLAIGTVRRATADSIFFTTFKQVDATHPGDPRCVPNRAGIMVYDEAEARPLVTREGVEEQKMMLIIIAVLALGLARFALASQ